MEGDIKACGAIETQRKGRPAKRAGYECQLCTNSTIIHSSWSFPQFAHVLISRLNQKSPFLNIVSLDQFQQYTERTIKVRPVFLIWYHIMHAYLLVLCYKAVSMLFISHFIDISLWDILQVSIVLRLPSIYDTALLPVLFTFFLCLFNLSRESSWVFNLFSRFLYHTMNIAFVWPWLKFIPIASFCLFHEKSFSFLPFPLLKHKPSSLQLLPFCFSPPHRLPISLEISVVNICSPLSVPLNFSFPLLLLSL